MSCVKCEQAQTPDPDNEITGLELATYVRVGPANVMISGCEEHLKDLIATMRAGLKAQRGET